MVRPLTQRGLGVLVCGGLFFSQVLASSPARAETPPYAGNELDLRYDAPPECPGRDALLSAIRERAPQGWSSADDRSFRVLVEPVDGAYRGRLDVERKGALLSTREIGGPTCSVVSTALAVFVAIALDPAEREQEVVGKAPVPEPPPPPPPPPLPPPPPAQQTKPSPVVVTAVPPRRVKPHWYWGTGVNADGLFHPSSAWGARVHAEITRLGPGTRLAPELRVSWGFAELVDHPPHGGEATVRFETIRPEACAVVEHVPLTAAACAGFDLGWLRATTRDLPKAGGTTVAWAAPTATLRPGWFLVDWLSLEAEIGVLFPLTRASFFVAEPERTVYRIPSVAITAAAGVRIWARLP